MLSPRIKPSLQASDEMKILRISELYHDDPCHYKTITFILKGRDAYEWLVSQTEDFPNKLFILDTMGKLSDKVLLTVLKAMPANTILDGLYKAGHYLHDAVFAFSCGEEPSHPCEGCSAETTKPHPFSAADSSDKNLGCCRAHKDIRGGACAGCIWKGMDCSLTARTAREAACERELEIERWDKLNGCV